MKRLGGKQLTGCSGAFVCSLKYVLINIIALESKSVTLDIFCLALSMAKMSYMSVLRTTVTVPSLGCS